MEDNAHSKHSRFKFILIILATNILIVSGTLISMARSQSKPKLRSSHGMQDTKVIPGNSSIAFYVLCGSNQNLTSDLRGKYWEFQLKQFQSNHSVVYISNGPLKTNGIDFLVLPEGSQPNPDNQFCIRTPESLKHFVKYNSDKKWFFRGTHDTFINITALSMMIENIERTKDPMKEFAFAFNFHEYGLKLYPHGGTGWLFSNYAVRKFVDNINLYEWMCHGSFDDVAMAYFMEKLGISYEDYGTNQFIVTWPNTEGSIIYNREYDKVKPCPEYYQLYPGARKMKPCPVRTAVSIHMHRVPMNEAWDQLRLSPDNFAVTFLDPNTPTFCKL